MKEVPPKRPADIDPLAAEVLAALQSRPEAGLQVQVAQRDVELEPPRLSPWPPLRLEGLKDAIASKMTALVRRGAWRDFEDIVRIARESEVATVDECWELWRRRNPGADERQARLAALQHLEALELRRPLPSLPEEERAPVADRRHWIREALVDVRGLCGGMGL